MKLRTSLYLLLVLALAACSGDAADTEAAADAAPEMSADEMAIAEVAEYWVTHYNMGHPDMVASRYADASWWGAKPAPPGCL